MNIRAHSESAIAMYLRDTFVHIQANSFGTMSNDATESQAQELFQHGLNTEAPIFVSGKHAYAVLQDIISSLTPEHDDVLETLTVSFVITGLRNVYASNSGFLSAAEHEKVMNVVSQPLPQFVNIFSYPSLEASAESYVPEYVLDGTVTEFDYLEIQALDFLQLIESNNIVSLPVLDMSVDLYYEAYELDIDDMQIK